MNLWRRKIIVGELMDEPLSDLGIGVRAPADPGNALQDISTTVF